MAADLEENVAGDVGMALAADRAERDSSGFAVAARRAMLALFSHQPTATGEDLGDACRAAGLHPADARAFGATVSGLARAGTIEQVGWCLRRTGRGRGATRVWRLRPVEGGAP